MIRLAILSDLHVEKGAYALPAVDADLIVLAGDVGWGLDGVAWIAANCGGRPAVYVAGNREHWHHPEGTAPRQAIRDAAAAVPGLHFLDDSAAAFTVGGRRLRVLGATLWTDYALEGDAAFTMARAETAMPDYKNGRGSDGQVLTARQVLAWSRASSAFLAETLAQPWDGPTLVVSHHLPTAESLKQRRPEHIPTVASVTSLDATIATCGPDLWVHGHSHWNCDYRLGPTRILSHQRGGPEAHDYAPLVVEI
ncbi:MAG: hypothetical protein HY985_16840 [Magnetospirillum sp.]|nr:hypothetical protein [Magnetospirillum sp.]